MSEPEMMYGTTLSVESMKVIAESIGVAALPDDAAKQLADDVSFKLKQIVQDAAKFMHHAKRTKLSIHDIDESLKIRNIEPQYGFVSAGDLLFFFVTLCLSVGIGSSYMEISRHIISIEHLFQ